MSNEHRTVSRVIGILETIARSRSGVSLSELSNVLDMAKSTTHSLVHGLVEKGYVDIEIDGKFSLGSATYSLIATTGESIVEHCRPTLEHLHAQSGETVTLALPVNNNLVYVDYIRGTMPISYSPATRQRRPLWPTSCGKIFLAGFDAAQTKNFLASSPEVDKDQLAISADGVRQNGFALNIGESVNDVAAVAVGVKISGKLRAAISIAGPRARVEGQLEEFGRAALDCVEKIE